MTLGEGPGIFSTHITSDLDRIGGYLTLIHEGRIVGTGTKDEIRHPRPGHLDENIAAGNVLLDPETVAMLDGLASC
jgi:ABC-type multidrug transport system ATPase subunit